MKKYLIIKLQKIIDILYKLTDKIGLSKDNAFILMFHHVTDEDVISRDDCKCTTSHFINVLNNLKRNNIEVVSMDTAINRIKRGKMKNFAVITFDDGIDNTFTTAYPILKELNLPFTIYVTTDYINKKGYITFEQLEHLKDEPLCTIGSHTLSHPSLRYCSNSWEEINNSRDILSKITGEEIIHFAFPYGSFLRCSFANIRQVKKAGYASAVSTSSATLNFVSTFNRYFLARINGCYYNASVERQKSAKPKQSFAK